MWPICAICSRQFNIRTIWVFCLLEGLGGRHNSQQNDTQHNDIDHNDTQHNDTQHNDTQHNNIHHNDNKHNDTQHEGLICDTQYYQQ